VSLRNSSITDEGMKYLVQHRLISLSLWYCDKVTHDSWLHLLANGDEIRNLEIGKQVNILRFREPNERTPIDFQINLPKLKRLVMHGVALQPSVSLSHLIELSYLDLSSCHLVEFSLDCLTQLPQLQTLILFNVWPLEREIPSICKLKSLQMLDISLPKPMMPSYNAPNETLKIIAESLPYLEHLDISGTNL
jgi:Zyg-11 protein homolog